METQAPYAGLKTPEVYAYTGTHGTGKTTAVYALAADLKRHRPDCEVGVVLETARMCPYPVVSAGNPAPVEIAQQWIFAAQIRAELDAMHRYDIVVCDRTVCDCIAYTIAGCMTGLAAEMMFMARRHARYYTRIYLRRMDTAVFAADDGFRGRDQGFRMQVERALVEVYRELGVVVETGNWKLETGRAGK